MPSQNSPSVTMQAVCAARVDNDIADPIASSLLQALPEARLFRDELDKLSRGMFTRTIMMRSHFFSKALLDHENKFEQLVVLCSGLDFRYINYPGWAATPTFLIDHPDSLALTNALTTNHASMLVNSKMVAVDLVFMTPTTIQQNLLNNGFDPKKPTLFLWEGATYYFQPAVVYQTIASISALCPTSSLVIDFANEGSFMQKRQPVRQEGEELDGVTKTMDLLSKKREPWFGFFKPSIISEHLQQAGFTSVHTVWDSILEQDLFGDVKMVPESMFYVQATKHIRNSCVSNIT